MIETPDIDWFGLSPILTLLGASALALIGSVLVPREARKAFAAIVAAGGFAAAIVLASIVFADSDDPETTIVGAFAVDRWTFFAQVLIFAGGLLAVGLAWGGRATTRASSSRSWPRPGRGWASSSARTT